MDLRPSAAHIWTKCSAQPLMASRMPPEIAGDPAREGTCAAWVAEVVLTGEVSTAAMMIGESHENGWLIEADMTNHIQKYIDLIRSYGGEVHAERKVRLNQYIAGTPDADVVLCEGGVLIVDDLKYGFGIVEPFENEQVSIYTGAILKMLRAQGVVINKIIIGIYQPRAWSADGIHRTWECTPDELMAFVAKIEAAGELCQAPNPMATAGPHCEHCEAATTCAANIYGNYHNYEYLAAQGQRHMKPDEMSEYLKFLEDAELMLKGAKSAAHAEVKARIGRGEVFKGWHMEQSSGKRRFTVDALTIAVKTGIKPTVPKMVTVAELERMKADPDVLASISETPRTAPRLKRVPVGYYKNLFKGR